MSKNSYKAQLNYYDSEWGWKSEGTASQGQWDGTGVRTGVLYFPGLAALKGKIINSVKLTATTGQTGYGTATTKTVYIYNSASQGGIKTSLNAGHRTGNALGSCKAPMWDNTKTFDVAFMAASIAAGYDTYCIYNGSSYTDYLKWTAVTLEVDWQEPATQPSLSVSTVEMGKSVTINTPAVNSTYRHNIWAAFGNAGVVIAERVVSSTTWTPDVNLASQISNATSGVATIYCDTFDANGTQLGTKTISITLTVPGSVVPSAGTLSAALAEDTSGTGLYVKGMGKAKLTLSGASGAYGSSITSYTITGGGWTATNGALTTGTLASAGNITFTATVTDSRGRKASTTRTINVIDYTKPGVAVCDVYRCDADGNRKKAGTYFAVEINASYSAITGNTLSITARYKKQSESSYGTAANVTNNGKTVLGGGNIGASTTYDMLVTVADKYNSLSIPRTLSTKSVLQSFKRSAGAAIGKVAELANWLDIAWHTRIRGDLKVDGKIIVADNYFTVHGMFINSAEGSIRGVGTASVHIIVNGIAQVDFVAKITTPGTRNDIFLYGVNIDMLRSIDPQIPEIIPIVGGVVEMCNADGSYNTEINGYGGLLEAFGSYWVPARVYSYKDDLGYRGAWPEAMFDTGMILRGTCYGKLN